MSDPLKPSQRLAVKIGAAIQSAVDECERRQAMRIADAVAEEREECAKEIEKQMKHSPKHDRELLASAIRARGQKA